MIQYLKSLQDRTVLYLFNRQYKRWGPVPQQLFNRLVETGTQEQIDATINRTVRRSLVGYLLDSKEEREEREQLHKAAAEFDKRS